MGGPEWLGRGEQRFWVYVNDVPQEGPYTQDKATRVLADHYPGVPNSTVKAMSEAEWKAVRHEFG